MKNINIAVDGPAGAGKSTVAKFIAKKLGIIYLDTGAMYRAAALKALRQGRNPCDESAVLPMLADIKIEIKYIDREQHVFLDGEDVSTAIREHNVSQAASDISKIKEVRLMLVDMQRKIAQQNDVIMDGRDIGSFVLPDADYKFYLTAAPEVRAQRRLKELEEKGQTANYEEILESIKKRDDNDTKRDFAPLVKAQDAVLVDSTYMTIDEVCAEILSAIKI